MASCGCLASKPSQCTLILGEAWNAPFPSPPCSGAGFQGTSLFSPAADGGFGDLQSKIQFSLPCKNSLAKASPFKNQLLDYVVEL